MQAAALKKNSKLTTRLTLPGPAIRPVTLTKLGNISTKMATGRDWERAECLSSCEMRIYRAQGLLGIVASRDLTSSQS